MLTQDDLKQISKIFEPLSKDLGYVRKDVGVIQKDLKDVKRRVKKLEKTVDVAIDMFNSDDVKLAKRVKRIESHLALPQEN